MPQLTRETYTQQGIFYRTEKILVLNWYNCFSAFSVTQTREMFLRSLEAMQMEISQDPQKVEALTHLLTAGIEMPEQSEQTEMELDAP